ncbi:hypothetical protein [Wolbachia endosymbiont (group A) of Nomada goodeniana]|uniref:hypothetical protein n=1 Tax=Wolbachia endosymbiont (group A) of Nomada goodeniana TaxID=3066207 RepID=UPI003341565A
MERAIELRLASSQTVSKDSESNHSIASFFSSAFFPAASLIALLMTAIQSFSSSYFKMEPSQI